MVGKGVPKVKICGITNLEDALAAVDAGCDALGFIFYRKSRRYITPAKAARIIVSLPDKILKVGVFVDASPALILKSVEKCGLDVVQLHGNESPEFCSRLKGLRLIKAIRVKASPDLEQLNGYKVWGFLFDTYSSAVAGGTGRVFDWKKLRGLKVPGKFILSGGLGPQNVARAVKTLRPDWVDACSSLERAPGKKDARKMVEFVARAKKCCK